MISFSWVLKSTTHSQSPHATAIFGCLNALAITATAAVPSIFFSAATVAAAAAVAAAPPPIAIAAIPIAANEIAAMAMGGGYFLRINFWCPVSTGQRPQATRLDFLLRIYATRKAAQQNGRHVDHRGGAGIGKGQQVHNAPRAKNFCRAPPEGSARRNCRRQKEAGGRSKRAGGKQQETKQSKHQM